MYQVILGGGDWGYIRRGGYFQWWRYRLELWGMGYVRRGSSPNEATLTAFRLLLSTSELTCV